jgi:hypothetical protein
LIISVAIYHIGDQCGSISRDNFSLYTYRRSKSISFRAWGQDVYFGWRIILEK